MRPRPLPTTRRPLCCSLALALAAFTPALLAQTTTPSATPVVEQSVQLSPFEVHARQDVGYQATNAITATKFNAPLADLPINMNIFTQELLEDINVPFANDAARYNASSTGSQGFRLRGFEAGRRVVDGFRMSFNYPGVLMQRVEVLKGPAGVMFGRASPGGMYNFVRKRPVEGAQFATLTAGTGWVEGNMRQRFTGDVNTSVGPFALRLVAGYAERESPADSAHGALDAGGSRWKAVYPVVSFRPFQGTQITVGYVMNDEHVRAQDGRHSARGQAIGGIPMSIRYNIDPFTDLGWGRRFDTLIDDKFVLVDQRVNEKLSFRVGYHQHDRYSADEPGVNNTVLELPQVDAAGNNVLGPNGQPVLRPVLRQGFRKQFGSRADIEDVQAHGVYSFDLLGGSNQVLFGYQRNFEKNPPVASWIARNRNFASGPAIIEGPGYRVRAPAVTNEYFRYVFFLEQPIPRGLPTDFVQDIVPNTVYTDDQLGTWTASWVGNYMDGRLHPMGGVSRNDYRGVRTDGVYNVENTLWQGGALYKLTKGLSAFVFYAESMDISHRRDGYNRPFGPIVADGYEGGLKFDSHNGRLSGTINYFNTRNNDIVVFDNLAPNQVFDVTGNINDRGAWVQVGQITSEGFEADVLLTLGEKQNYQAKLSYANLSAKTTKDANRANIGVVPQGHVKNSVAFWHKYTFVNGPLKGAFVGGGGYWKSGELVGGNRRRPATKEVDLLLGYTFKPFGRTTRVSFNMRDVFGTNYGEFGLNPATGIPFKLDQPRTYLLDVSVTF